MLEAEFLSIHALLGGPIQFVTPDYQRHYVWNEEKQWKPLWQDIQDTIAVNAKIEIIHDRHNHFMGAIIGRHLPIMVGAVPRYEIIDGQQRLTTFQIILCAIDDVCRAAELKDIQSHVGEYIQNGGLLHDRRNPNRLRNPDEAYKVIPSKVDWDSFKALVDGNIDGCQGAIREAYNFFKQEIEGFIRMGDPRSQMILLVETLIHSFGVAQILITSRADSDKIFESINARGVLLDK